MTSDTTTTTKSNNSISSSFLSSTNGLKIKQNSNIRKFFNRFPQQPKSPPLSPEHHHHPFLINTGGDINKCPAMSTSLSSPLMSSIDTVNLSPTQNQIDLVRTSWERVSEIRHPNDDRNISASHAFGLAFYDALFEMDSDVKPLFKNVFQQARALTGMISYIARAPGVTSPASTCCTRKRPDSPPTTPTTIRDINAKKKQKIQQGDCTDEYDEGDPEKLASQMRELGARHYFYHVKPKHFELVGPAFVSALKKRLGDEYTDEIGDAWIKANSHAAYNMKIGFESQQAWEEGSSNHSSSKRIKASCTIQ